MVNIDNVVLYDEEIPYSTINAKDLGIIIGQKISWKNHIKLLCAKTAMVLRKLYFIKNVLGCELKYFSIIIEKTMTESNWVLFLVFSVYIVLGNLIMYL